MIEPSPETSSAVKEAVATVRNRRTDAMFVAAFGAVIWLVYLVVYERDISEYAQGVLTLVLGAFIGFLTAMYQYETGTTRGAQVKDATIKSMAEANSPAGAVTPAPAEKDGTIPAASAVEVQSSKGNTP